MNSEEALNIKKIFIQPCELYATKKPRLISTILGSCVSVIFYDKAHSLSAMSHCMMPYPAKIIDVETEEGFKPYRYINIAIKEMLNLFTMSGIPKDQIVVKLFGGANVLSSISKNQPSFQIGSRNIEYATQVIQELGLKIHNSCIGGDKGYKILFNSGNGEVTLRRLDNATSQKQTA